jgi:hypothetical protein
MMDKNIQVEIITRYTHTFLWLQRYDEGLLDEPEGQAGGHLPTAKEAMQALQELKQSLMARGEATELFACYAAVTDWLRLLVIWIKASLVSQLTQRLKAKRLIYCIS